MLSLLVYQGAKTEEIAKLELQDVMYNLRKVQYLAGHRYISSTEAYQLSEMQRLTEEVNKFHPLG